MLRSRTVHTIRELAHQGYSIHAIAQQTGLARNTVRKYLRGAPMAAQRPKRPSKLDPFKDQIHRWVEQDHLLNCVTMLQRLRPLGYTGGITILKDFVQALRPPKAGHYPVRRYETQPGEQMQIDWGEFLYEEAGRRHKVYGFIAILSYSRMRFVCFIKRCDTTALIGCMMIACEYFGGLPQAILADRMKSVLLAMDGHTPQWNQHFADFLAAVGVVPRVCRAYTPQTKGKVERSIGIIKQSFWPGIQFTDIFDLNAQARQWCDQRNGQIHQTTRARPVDRWPLEKLRPLPSGFAWERFRTEDRRVSWDGYVSYDGVLYGVPSEPPVVGSTVQVSQQAGTVTIWHSGQAIAQHVIRSVSGTLVPHPEQFRTVAPASVARHAPEPMGHQVEPPQVARRPLTEYDRLCGVAVEVGA
jgi:transposase